MNNRKNAYRARKKVHQAIPRNYDQPSNRTANKITSSKVIGSYGDNGKTVGVVIRNDDGSIEYKPNQKTKFPAANNFYSFNCSWNKDYTIERDWVYGKPLGAESKNSRADKFSSSELKRCWELLDAKAKT